jgi:hypothetical protein
VLRFVALSLGKAKDGQNKQEGWVLSLGQGLKSEIFNCAAGQENSIAHKSGHKIERIRTKE